MFNRIFKSRYCVLFSFMLVFVCTSFLIRLALFIVSLSKVNFGITSILKIFLLGLDYDFGVAMLLTGVYNLYLLFLPGKLSNSSANKVITYATLFLMLLVSFFSFFAELTFWQEFESRFNFIAVDYLVYTYEVVNNINESYPLPYLIGGVLILVFFVMAIFARTKVFRNSFESHMPYTQRAVISGLLLIIAISYPFLLSNAYAEGGNNRYENELSKAGIYSFFAAFKKNELNYNDFYSMMPVDSAYGIVRNQLKEKHTKFINNGASIKRFIQNDGAVRKPNIIMITVESLSADFMSHFGNTQHLTPVLDSLANRGILFANMYATGTRTVRGMEALTLSIPPTPGSSIVRRPDNQNLTTVGHIFQKAGYTRTFYYGGDGYFDNMNEYFGSNGFDIVDRGRNIKIGDTYTTKRTVIPNNMVHFKNAWGISDGDLFDAVIMGADKDYTNGKPFYSFVMTTSNHRPFTFPDGKITMQPGTRAAAVRYTDFAIGEFISKIKKKAWFENTVIIIVADHCAGSAGKNEVDISKYHIPCIILNLPNRARGVSKKLCSQIDLYPTIFSLLGWKYESNLYGQDVLNPSFTPRAVLGTYQKLAYLKKDSLVILGPQRKVETYLFNQLTNIQTPDRLSPDIIEQAKANYQTAYDLFKSGGLNL